jgi:pSer/pThr/pTyr-binding forkhead associated (FHA) protein
MFIFVIIRMIYLDIRAMESNPEDSGAYLKLLNRLDSLPYRVRDSYLLKGTISLGRSSENDIVIKDPFVSKRHLMITKDEEEYFIEDLGSSNGTYVNKQLLVDAAKLVNGDIIKIGDLEFIFVNRR